MEVERMEQPEKMEVERMEQPEKMEVEKMEQPEKMEVERMETVRRDYKSREFFRQPEVTGPGDLSESALKIK